MSRRLRALSAFRVLICLSAGLTACAHERAPPLAAGVGALRTRGVLAEPDPTVRGARIVPEKVEEDRSLGAEPGGGVRGIAAGVRVVSMPSGAVLATDERLPQPPQITVALPERLGGGFLFVLGSGSVGSRVWRADKWLAEAREIYQANASIQKVVLGLDRVYLRAQNGAHTAIDGRTGTRIDLGPWPGSSYVGAYAAADGWRAVAVNDLRGAVATFDAGATWRPLALPIDVKDVRLFGDAIAVGGLDPARDQAWYEVRPDGQVGRLGALPQPSAPPPAPQAERADVMLAPRPLGKRPLVAAVEDGWPLSDGTAVVARDGALSRVRLADGALIEHVADAFPLKPARCHPVPLGRMGAFGFVCGEVRGRTVVYAYEWATGGLTPLHRFERPRIVLAYGNGALGVHGSCDPFAEDPAIAIAGAEERLDHAYCLLPSEGPAHPVDVKGSNGNERVVLLADGRVAVLSPPTHDVAVPRLTLLAGDRATTLELKFHAKGADPAAPLSAEVARALRLGVWVDGFEERRPGVLGGWIDTGGAFLGVEIAVDGSATHGPFIRDAGAPMVSGRYGLGWGASRRGLETTDGGMTWTPIDVPDPLVATRAITARSCGPIGCTAAGWIRIGWGAPRKSAPADAPSAHFSPGMAPGTPQPVPLQLTCEPLAPAPPSPPEPHRATAPRVAEPTRGRMINPWGGATLSVLGTANEMDLLPFYNAPPPALQKEERGLSFEANERIERFPRTGPLARLYAWGPRTGEWEHASRWIARWVSPFGGWNDVHSSQASPTPQLLLDAARFSSPGVMPMSASWQLGVGDDGAHALLAARRSSGRGGASEISVFELEDGRSPVELRRADGEPFTDLDAAVRAGGRWYIATPPSTDWTSTVWQVDGPIARELARIPRAGMDTRPTGARLARRSDGRAIGFVVDGQPLPDRAGPQRWVLPIDVETGAQGDPEWLHAADLSDRGAMQLCTEDDTGWILDTGWNLGMRIHTGNKYAGQLNSVDARVRLTSERACLERAAGTMGALSTEQIAALTRPGPVGNAKPVGTVTGSAIPVVAISASSRLLQTRYPLRCTRR